MRRMFDRNVQPDL